MTVRNALPPILMLALSAGASGPFAQRAAPVAAPRSLRDHEVGSPPRRNVLLLVADDLGVDKLGLYGLDVTPAPTPRLDQLAQSGVLFRNAWSQPTCSPTRSTIQTGRYGFRTGIGRVITANGLVPALPLEEPTIPEMLDRGSRGAYAHAAIGKWHLGNADVGGALAPNLAGYGHFAGSLEGQIGNYFFWDKVVDGVSFATGNYATSDAVDDALDWIGDQDELWFCMVAFQAPHAPFHAPPGHLHTQSLPPQTPAQSCGAPGADPRPFFDAMVEAMDTEIGRLLDGLDPETRANTTVIFLGDNGTDSCLVEPPFSSSHAKSTLYEGGVHVPMLVSGAGVAGRGECEALVNTTDLMATIAQLAGFELEATLPEHDFDSVSMVPYFSNPGRPSIRRWLFAEVFSPNGPGNPRGLPACPPTTVCQTDLGFDGPGNLRFDICGAPLYGRSTEHLVPLTLTGAPPFAPARLRIGPLHPAFDPSIGAVVASQVPSSLLDLQTSAQGEIRLTLWTGGLSDDSTYQFQVNDGAQPQGWALSNALECEFWWTDMKAIRDARFKLLRLDPCTDELYDLANDPLEVVNLLNAPLSSETQLAYWRLSDRLDRIANSPPATRAR